MNTELAPLSEPTPAPAQAEREYEQRMDATGVLMRAAYKAQDFVNAAHWLHVRAVLRSLRAQEGSWV